MFIIHYYLLYIIILVNITILHKYFEFLLIYNNSKEILVKNYKSTKECLKGNYIRKCNIEYNDIKSKVDIKVENIYNKIFTFFTPIIQPSKSYEDIIVGIPCSPQQVLGRIAIRNTFAEEKRVNNYSVKYIFATGIPRSSKYSIEYLKYESNMYNDIIVFNMINSYENLTYTMFSLYKWIIEKKSFIKFFIRCNLDALFIPHNLGLVLNKKYDIIGEFYKKQNVSYPQGSFYIFSVKVLKEIYYYSNYVKLSRYDDVIYGVIIKLLSNISILDIYNSGLMFSQKKSNYKINQIKKSFAIHPLCPTVLYTLYNIIKNNKNSSFF